MTELDKLIYKEEFEAFVQKYGCKFVPRIRAIAAFNGKDPKSDPEVQKAVEDYFMSQKLKELK